MLAEDPEERISLKDAIHHDYIKNCSKENHVLQFTPNNYFITKKFVIKTQHHESSNNSSIKHSYNGELPLIPQSPSHRNASFSSAINSITTSQRQEFSPHNVYNRPAFLPILPSRERFSLTPMDYKNHFIHFILIGAYYEIKYLI